MPLTREKLRAPQDLSLYVRIPHGNFPVSVLAPCYRRGSLPLNTFRTVAMLSNRMYTHLHYYVFLCLYIHVIVME